MGILFAMRSALQVAGRFLVAVSDAPWKSPAGEFVEDIMKSSVVGCSVLLTLLAGCGNQISDPPGGSGPIIPPEGATSGTAGSSVVAVTTGGFVGPGGTY